MPKKSRQCMKGNNQICLTVWLYIDCITIHWLYYYTLTVLLYIDYTVYTMAIAFYTFLGAWILSKKRTAIRTKGRKTFFPVKQNCTKFMALTLNLWKSETTYSENCMLWCHNLEATKRGKFSPSKWANGRREECDQVVR